ncbi:hypothetical protein ACNOYE_06040 [Nannocystaceae bacterium ST9]
MATLHDVIRDVASQFEVAYKQVGDDAFALEVAFEDGRTQLVTVGIEDDEDGDSWMSVYSVIGPLAELDAEALLEANSGIGYAFIAASEGEAYACAQLPLESVDVDLCKAMIWSVAMFADGIEDQAFGTDEG